MAALHGFLSPDDPSRVFVYDSGSGSLGPIVNPSKSNTVSVEGTTISSPRYATLNADLSALSIRATEYLQRWKEVVQFSSKDYSDQMAAQFGIKAPEYMGIMLIISVVGLM